MQFDKRPGETDGELGGHRGETTTLVRVGQRVFSGVLLLAIVASTAAAIQQRDGRTIADGGDGDISIVADGVEVTEPDTPVVSDTTPDASAGAQSLLGERPTEPEDADSDGDREDETDDNSAPLVATVTVTVDSDTTSTEDASSATTATVTVPSTAEPSTSVTPSSIVSTTTSATTATTEAPAPTTATTEPPPNWVILSRFDFGPVGSPVASGHTRVGAGGAAAFTITGGTIQAATRAGGGAANQDMVFADGPRRLSHVLPNGRYRITATIGDADYAHDRISIDVEGISLARNADVAAGAFRQFRSEVSVRDGSLDIDMTDNGGTDPNWVLTSLIIEVDNNNLPS